MSDWIDFELESKILAILRSIQPRGQGHHFGTPYLTAYQIAFELRRRYPDDIRRLGKPLGGAGAGVKAGPQSSLAGYIANQLSKRTKNNRLDYPIEGADLSYLHIKNLVFGDDQDQLWPSQSESGHLSMFRLRKSG